MSSNLEEILTMSLDEYIAKNKSILAEQKQNLHKPTSQEEGRGRRYFNDDNDDDDLEEEDEEMADESSVNIKTEEASISENNLQDDVVEQVYDLRDKLQKENQNVQENQNGGWQNGNRSGRTNRNWRRNFNNNYNNNNRNTLRFSNTYPNVQRNLFHRKAFNQNTFKNQIRLTVGANNFGNKQGLRFPTGNMTAAAINTLNKVGSGEMIYNVVTKNCNVNRNAALSASAAVKNATASAAAAGTDIQSLLGLNTTLVRQNDMSMLASKFLNFLQEGNCQPMHRPMYDMKMQKEIHILQQKPLVYKSAGEVVSSDGPGVQNCKVKPTTSGLTLNCRFSS